MNCSVRVITTLFLFFSSTAFSQEWAPEQQDVWASVEELVEDFYAGNIQNLKRHPDFVFWNAENPVLGDKQAAELQDETLFNSGVKFRDASVTPLTIQVNGDFATVNAYIRVTQIAPGQEGPTPMTARFHSDWKKEDGVWLNISNFLYREK